MLHLTLPFNIFILYVIFSRLRVYPDLVDPAGEQAQLEIL